jgi:hypothetical protein
MVIDKHRNGKLLYAAILSKQKRAVQYIYIESSIYTFIFCGGHFLRYKYILYAVLQYCHHQTLSHIFPDFC